MTPSGQSKGLATCQTCGLLSRMPQAPAAACTRCGAELTFRKRRSLDRTWAYLLAAYVLYVPANLLTIMHSESFVSRRDDTIMSGIVYLWSARSYGLAVVVFLASITVPLVKLLVMTALLWSIKSPSRFTRLQRTRAYRVIDTIGRWSMLDVYVAALLTSLVQSSVALVRIGPAAVPFTAVVLLTLMASRSFDARLLWDDPDSVAPPARRLVAHPGGPAHG